MINALDEVARRTAASVPGPNKCGRQERRTVQPAASPTAAVPGADLKDDA